MKHPRTCVGSDGKFIVGIHRPEFEVKNLRDNDWFATLGVLEDGGIIDNRANFPDRDLFEPKADIIYEIPNAFPFRGTTYINTTWADAKAKNPASITIEPPTQCSFLGNMKPFFTQRGEDKAQLLEFLPRPLLLALADSSTDPEELTLLAKKSCRIIFARNGVTPVGIGYRKTKNRVVPDVYDHELFEVLVNNRYLPDDYKTALVLKPGVQGHNEITGEYLPEDRSTHVFEYLRRNSYIPWGHFASNMANDAVRYRARDLSQQDMTGIRHLYYQRVYARLAGLLSIDLPDKRACLTTDQLEELRQAILKQLANGTDKELFFNASLWGWNYGFGYAQSGERLHASHQMIHQQNALVPRFVSTETGDALPSFSSGDLVHDFMIRYNRETGTDFFKNYLEAIRTNIRTDGNADSENALVVWEDENVLLFVPKAPISEWELQLMPKTPVGNILEAGASTRSSIDQGMLTALKTLDIMGARMVTSIEFSKRFDIIEPGQHLLYSFIPRLPYAPDTFSEAQLRFICGAFPEDVALACRNAIAQFDPEGE